MDLRLTFNILAILGSGALAGVLLAIGMSFGAYWRSLPPAAFLDWFGANMRYVPRAVPLTLVPALIGLCGSLWMGWENPRERLLWGAALLCCVLKLVVTAIWNAPLNHRFASGVTAVTEVPGALHIWITAHSARIALIVASTVLGIIATQR